MTQEDYSRTVRAMNEVRVEDQAAIVCILKEDGSTFISTVGGVQEQAELLERIVTYYESVMEQVKGGRK